MNFGEQMKYVRKQLNISQTRLGELLGVNFTTVNRLENGKTNPSYRTLMALNALCKENNIDIPKEILQI